MKVFTKAIFALGFLLAISQQAQAGLVTWNLRAAFDPSTTVTGTVTFDNTSLICSEISCSDPDDTHVFGNFLLTSTAFGWVNQEFNGIELQPFYNPLDTDGPHVDDDFIWGNNSLSLMDDGAALLTGGLGLTAGRWSFVPEPESILLVGLGIAALCASRRRQLRPQLAV